MNTKEFLESLIPDDDKDLFVITEKEEKDEEDKEIEEPSDEKEEKSTDDVDDESSNEEDKVLKGMGKPTDIKSMCLKFGRNLEEMGLTSLYVHKILTTMTKILKNLGDEEVARKAIYSLRQNHRLRNFFDKNNDGGESKSEEDEE